MTLREEFKAFKDYVNGRFDDVYLELDDVQKWLDELEEAPQANVVDAEATEPPKPEFQVGDLVEVIRYDDDTDFTFEDIGLIGVVRKVTDSRHLNLAVEFARFDGGHNCGGLTGELNGNWVDARHVRHV